MRDIVPLALPGIQLLIKRIEGRSVGVGVGVGVGVCVCVCQASFCNIMFLCQQGVALEEGAYL